MKIIATFLLLLYSLSSYSQHYFCGQYEMEQKYLNPNASIKLKRELLEKFTQDFSSDYFSKLHQNKIQSDTILFIIPVVFHIMHEYGAENISKSQVLDVMRIINEYFQKTNADTSQIIPSFKSAIGDAQIEFRLAQIDPQGNCTDGITRHQTYLTNGGNDLLKTIVQWPPDKYLNIWVEDNSQNSFSAYAYLPGAPPAVDGIVITDEYVGSIGSAQGNLSFAVLAHEIGHYLNLWHTWGPTNNPGLASNCSIDDLVFDTPNCIGGVCNLSAIACNGVDTVNVQNMMDYCAEQMFTLGQVARMQAALNSPTSNRNNLWTQTNLQLTGTNNGYVPVLCSPVADFSNKTIRICEGESVTFFNQSYGGDFSTINWQFTGGNITASTDTNPTVQYNTAGVYDVTLTVTNASGTSTVTRYALVEVSPALALTTIPYSQDFETINFPNANWSFESTTGTHWQTTNLASVSGAKSIFLQYDSVNFSTEDIFYTESFNLSNITAPAFNFKIAFANRNASTDNLKIFISTDCGQTWIMKYSKSGNSLATAIDTSQNFIPTPAQWRQDGMNINSATGQNNVRFKFQFTSQGGNNVYIDDINISGITGYTQLKNDGINLIIKTNGINQIQISLDLIKTEKVYYFVADAIGRIICETQSENLSVGKHFINIKKRLNTGLYWLSMEINGQRWVKKFAVTN